jgi:hypothetical protein
MKFLLLFFLFLIFELSAQQKPFEKMSKKELIEHLKLAEQKLDQQDKLILELKISNSEIIVLKDQYHSCTDQLDTIFIKNIQIADLENQLFKIKNEAPKNIEVLDLYNLGYQPFKNNEKQYQQFLSETTNAVVKSRLVNISKMIVVLQSKKVEDELKNQLFLNFKSAFRGYFDTLTIEELSNLDVSMSDFFYEGLLKKTQLELESSSRENRWILLLESIRL